MESDEDDEEPQNEPGTSSNSQPTVPILPLDQGPAASSQGPAAFDNSVDENSVYGDEYSAQSQNTERTMFYPDLYVLTNDEHWTMTPETNKYAAAAGSFCFRDYRKWRSTGHMRLDHYAVCTTIFVPQ